MLSVGQRPESKHPLLGRVTRKGIPPARWATPPRRVLHMNLGGALALTPPSNCEVPKDGTKEGHGSR